MKNCLLCGVGGQGTVLASRILATAAMEEGKFARTAETIGMAQRGGSVVSHVRYGEEVHSPLIPFGGADMLLGFEPGEAVRNYRYLKKGGMVIACDRTVFPVMSAYAKEPYQGEEMISWLRNQGNACLILPAEVIERECKTLRVLNVALVGAAISTGILGLQEETVRKVLAQKVKPEYLALNEKALELGEKLTEELK